VSADVGCGSAVGDVCLFVCRQARVRLADGFRGEESRVIETRGVKSSSNGVAVSRDGATLLMSDGDVRSHAIHEFRVSDGLRLRGIGSKGDGPLQFKDPYQVWIAPDNHVFVAEYGNDRVQVLTPNLDFHGFVGVGQLSGPSGVCADDAVVVVSEYNAHRVSVFSRRDGALLRHLGCEGDGDGQLLSPHGLCFMSGHRHVAVADFYNDRVSVFGIDGEFIRHVGVGVLSNPHGVATSACDELVVADTGNNNRVAVFSASGELLKSAGRGVLRSVACHAGTVFAQDFANEKCILFE
jgi:DNA-binding beta-propeller fold protein YncE